MNYQQFCEKYKIPANGGIPSFCTANELVLEAIFDYAAKSESPVLIEATCNQVNQFGGYTGLNPFDFSKWVKDLAAQFGVDSDRLILGGDHLGPNPWCKEPAESAMEKAKELVKQYVEAGFTKIHIDASMACGDEDHPSFETVAERAAILCEIAEKHAPNPENLVYVIGTEVPTPGGELEEVDTLSVTTPSRFKQTVDTHLAAFKQRNLENIWHRVIAVVTQPGVDFSHTSVHKFEANLAQDLVHSIEAHEHLTFEAHSTDYQPSLSLAELVQNRFSILKVGPELTFRMREALFSLAEIEQQICNKSESNLIKEVDQVMSAKPNNWQPYYQGDAQQVSLMKHFSYSDRIRYYWSEPQVKMATQELLSNLEQANIPETLVSQHFPYRDFGALKTDPKELIYDHVNLCIARYYRACGF